MIPLQVHLIGGPQAGTRLQLNQSPVSFGRAPDNTLVLDVSVVSRNHGELVFEDGRWLLVNHSQNGTRVGRKRVTRKPRVLAEGDEITIGEETLFRVHLSPPSDNAASEAADEESADPQAAAGPATGKKNRSRLMILLGAWFAFCIGMFILLATMGGNTDGGSGSSELARYETVDEVSKILYNEPSRREPDDILYEQNLQSARDAYNLSPKDLYIAYDRYQTAITYMPADQQYLFGKDQSNYDAVITELAIAFQMLYEQAYISYRQGHFDVAQQTLDRLVTRVFPASSDHELYKDAMRLRSRVSQ